MKKQRDSAGNIPGVLAMTFFALALALLLGTGCAVQQVGTATTSEASPTPLMVVLEASPTPPPTATPTQEMIFYSPIDTPTVEPTPTEEKPTPTPTAGKPTPTAPDLDDYVFGEPQVVLTHTSSIGIASWLPDSERLLITRRIPNTAREFIETFNVNTGELHRFGEWQSTTNKPVWLSDLQAVAFVDHVGDKAQLHISYGDERQGEEQRLNGLFYTSVAALNGGRKVIFFGSEIPLQPQLFDVAQKTRQATSIDLASFKTPEGLEVSIYNKIASHPAKAKVVFYKERFFLADLDTGAVREIDLGAGPSGKIWAIGARWSPDGRYVAMLTAEGWPVTYIDLTVLSTENGRLYRLNFNQKPYDISLYNLAWAPDSRHLLVLGKIGYREDENFTLYLADALTGEFRAVLSARTLGLGVTEMWGMDWSPDGRLVALTCPTLMETEPTLAEGRICIIPVSIHRGE